MNKILEKSSLYIFLFILAYMPFYVFISTWVGTSTGFLDAIKISKEIILVVGFTLALITTSKVTIRRMAKDKLVWLIAGYAILTVILALIKPVDKDAEAIAVVYNLRFLLFFLYAALLVHKHGRELIKTSIKLVVALGTIVALLGIFQVALLPDSALSRIGYSRENGTPAVFYISDETKAIERAYSTVKDPNSLGSYLIIVLSFSALFLLLKWPKDRRLLGGIIIAVLLCLFLTYSRSAWIGAVVSLSLLVLLLPRTKEQIMKHKQALIFTVLSTVILIVVGLFSFRNTSVVQNLVLHVGDDAPTTSNSQRSDSIINTIEKVTENLIGYGPGTAGPASFKNDIQGSIISENYYLQLAYEIGVLGLAIFVAICGVVAKRLYEIRKKDYIAIALLASFAGLAITNMLVHIWFYEPVAYTWWGIAGLILYSYSIKVSITNTKKSRLTAK